LRDDEIVISQWLADDLQVRQGDEIAMCYFLPESGAKLTEATNIFRVRSIVPMEMPWEDRTLMPDFPGIEKAESTSEWDAGFPLTYKVRDKDDDYWKQYRGTPKAFITLAAGQKMWGNRFGNLTAIRFPIPTNSVDPNFKADLEKKILANLKPEELGLLFEPVREQALKAAEESQDFGGLFLGFSFFLIIAALLLMAMLFQFGLEQRAPEIGTLLALGFTPKQVRKLLLSEGVTLAFLGGVIGALGGIYFAKAMLHGLTTVWRDAVGATALNFHFTGQTLVIGILASVAVSAVTIWLALRKFVKRPARELLAGEVQSPESRVQSRAWGVGVIALVAALGLVGWTLAKGETANAGAFFGAGALVLAAGLSFVSAWLEGLVGSPLTPALSLSDGERKNRRQSLDKSGAVTTTFTLSSLGLRGCARRRKRSLATVAMLACGSFLIVSIGVFRLDANRDATKRTSGTGGFALIGETTMPVVHDLNTKSGREFFALNEGNLNGVNFVPFRVRAGDEASCLNLNRAQKPRLLGVDAGMLKHRFTFAVPSGPSVHVAPWSRLNRIGDRDFAPVEGNEIPAIGDANSIQWAMHKKVGDTIDYVDERGQPFKVRIVGAVANSILQGQLIIDEAEFVKRFPGESGYRMFLIDAPSNAVSQVSATLSRAMQDVGLELTPAAQRLAQFNAVQNTYLGTFQVLGGLGLLLGSVGLGIVVLRNVLERRGELAVLLAVGFRKATVQWLLLIENGALLLIGLGIGVIAAAVAVLPAVLSPSAQLPYGSLALTLAAVLVNGALWTLAATQLAVRGDLLKALRNE
jgi:ABC-type antimicrobial peptide transport system permease subunit